LPVVLGKGAQQRHFVGQGGACIRKNGDTSGCLHDIFAHILDALLELEISTELQVSQILEDFQLRSHGHVAYLPGASQRVELSRLVDESVDPVGDDLLLLENVLGPVERGQRDGDGDGWPALPCPDRIG
jgi:hypothetical protein